MQDPHGLPNNGELDRHTVELRTTSDCIMVLLFSFQLESFLK